MLRATPTPIEVHCVQGTQVFVKRDDLAALPPAPPLAKLRGFYQLVSRWKTDGVTLVGAFEAGASAAGHAVAAAVSQVSDVECIIGYVQEGQTQRASVRAAVDCGAKLFPVKRNVMNVCFGQTRRHVESLGGRMIPFGFEFEEALQCVANEAATVPVKCSDGGTVVVSCGSGVTLAGIWRGLNGRPRRFIGVSSGRSEARIRACLQRNGVGFESVELVAPIMPYRQPYEGECPFPADKHYDRKAWKFLVDHVDDLATPILFWNVGGSP